MRKSLSHADPGDQVTWARGKQEAGSGDSVTAKACHWSQVQFLVATCLSKPKSDMRPMQYAHWKNIIDITSSGDHAITSAVTQLHTLLKKLCDFLHWPSEVSHAGRNWIQAAAMKKKHVTGYRVPMMTSTFVLAISIEEKLSVYCVTSFCSCCKSSFHFSRVCIYGTCALDPIQVEETCTQCTASVFE